MLVASDFTFPDWHPHILRVNEHQDEGVPPPQLEDRDLTNVPAKSAKIHADYLVVNKMQPRNDSVPKNDHTWYLQILPSLCCKLKGRNGRAVALAKDSKIWLAKGEKTHSWHRLSTTTLSTALHWVVKTHQPESQDGAKLFPTLFQKLFQAFMEHNMNVTGFYGLEEVLWKSTENVLPPPH